MKDAKVFSKLDLKRGYHQIPLAEKDKAKTNFWGPNRQLFKWNVVQYGLKNAPPFFQRIMNRKLRGVIYARCYIDDIIMWSADVKLHMGHLRAVLKLLDSKGLRVHPRKCVFGTDTIDFLGYKLTGKGFKPQLEKTKAIREMPTPKDFPSPRAVLGLFSSHRKFVGHFSSIAAPLNALLKGDAKWEWGESRGGLSKAEGGAVW